MKLLEDIAAIMDKELLMTVEYTANGISLKVTKAGFTPQEAPQDELTEAKGYEEEDNEETILFWSADGSHLD